MVGVCFYCCLWLYFLLGVNSWSVVGFFVVLLHFILVFVLNFCFFCSLCVCVVRY